MRGYIGTKIIRARQMTRLTYNDYRGWTLPDDENGDDAGYLVEYVDGGRANDSRHKGYISWSPADVFHKAYRPLDGMTFGIAIELLKQGERVARAGWNGNGMWLVLVSPVSPEHTEELDIQNPSGFYAFINNAEYPYATRTFIAIKTVNNDVVPWVASQTDILAEDWFFLQ